MPDHTPAHAMPATMRSLLRGVLCLALIGLIAACGFRLKGVSPLPFDTLYTNISENSAFGAHLRRSIQASSPHTRFVSDPADAQARLTQLLLDQSLREVSISPQGQVEEYELKLTLMFQLTNASGHLILAPTTLQAIREIPYDSSALQAKESEISTLFIEMQQSLVDQVVRRLSSPAVASAYENPEDLPVDGSAPADAPVDDNDSPVPSPVDLRPLTPGLGLP